MAWEARGKTEVVIGCCHTGTVSMAWALSFARLRHPPNTIYSFNRGSPWDVARNSIVDKFMEVGGRWLFFLDSDVLCPEHALERLMSHNVPIVGGLFYRRHLDRPGMAPHPAIWKLVPTGTQVTCPACKSVHTAKEGKYQPIMNPPPNRLIEVDTQGAGCLLVHRRVFERVEKPWFRWTLGWVDPGVSEDFYFCSPAGTLVYGEDIKPIEKVKVGDKVFTHKGSLRRITRTFKRQYTGKLIKITPYYGEPVYLTPNHPILARRIEGTGKTRRYALTSYLDGKLYEGESEIKHVRNGWVPASEMRPNDRVFLPKIANKGLKKSTLWLDRYVSAKNAIRKDGKVYYNRTHKDAPRIPLKVSLDADLMRLFGYYVAEGSLLSNRCAMTFSFNMKEREYIEDVKNLLKRYFGMNGTEVNIEENHTTQVVFSSKYLSHLFGNLCGHNARRKKLPRFFIHLDEAQLGELLKGYWRGDGCFDEKNGFRMATVSRKLAHQLKLAFLKLGVLASINNDGERYVVYFPKKFEAEVGKIVGVPAKDGEKRWGFREISALKVKNIVSPKGGFWIKIRAVEEVQFEGDVYNLEVSGANSYVANGVAVHNCERVIDAGFKPLCDTGIRCGHVGDFVVDGMGRIASPGV